MLFAVLSAEFHSACQYYVIERWDVDTQTERNVSSEVLEDNNWSEVDKSRILDAGFMVVAFEVHC